MTFEEWWDGDNLTQTNPFREDSPAWYAWGGWNARGKADAEFIISKTVYDDVFSFSPEGLKAISKALLDNKD